MGLILRESILKMKVYMEDEGVETILRNLDVNIQAVVSGTL